MGVGLGLIRWRERLATFLFGADGVAVGHVRFIDVQVVALAILGVWLVAEGMPELIRRIIWVPQPAAGRLTVQYGPYPIGQFGADAVRIGVGIFLVLRGEVVTRLWISRSNDGAAA